MCINASRWDCTLEALGGDRFAVRLGLRTVKGLGNAEAGRMLAGRADRPFTDVDDVWRRSAVQAACLVQLAEADAFQPALRLARREALWAIKALRDEPLALFAAAARREQDGIPEIDEPLVALKALTAGREVVEDYRHVGLTLRQHPVSFLRQDLTRQRILTCAQANVVRDGRAVKLAGLVLVRQRPGSAKGVMFITVEDETGIANLVIWPTLFEAQRRVVLCAGMLAIDGRVQREGEVVHIVAVRLHDLSGALASIGDHDAAFPLPHGCGDAFHGGGQGNDPRNQPPRGLTPQETYTPALSPGAIRVQARNFK